MKSFVLPVLLSVLLALASARSIDFCPAHRTTSVTLEDGSTESVIEPCPDHDSLPKWGQPLPSRNTVAFEANSKDQNTVAFEANHDPLDVLPKFVGQIRVGQKLQWKGRCFRQNTATVQVDDNGFTLSIDVADPSSLLCAEFTLFPTSTRFLFHMFITRGHNEIRANGWQSQEEKEAVMKNGLPIFIFPEQILRTLMDSYEIYKLFVAVGNKTADELVKFHKTYFGYDFKPRKMGILDVPESAIHNGDVFALHVMTSHETIDWMLTGSHSGHVAVAFRIDGQAYVFETTDATFIEPGPMYGFHMTPFKKWVQIYAGQGYEIDWLPLRRDISARLDVNKAYKWFLDNRMDFTTPSFGFTALDTPNDNFPPPLTADTFFMLLQVGDQFKHEFVHYMILEGLNKRFEKYYAMSNECPDMACAFELAVRLNTTLADVMALPEVDGWLYKGKPSIVCANVVMSMLRESGVFGNMFLTTGEFDPKDVYQLGIYESEWLDRPQACWGSTGLPKEVPYCQLAGRWAMELPEYNSVKPYPHMNEHCGAQPPTYHRFPDGC